MTKVAIKNENILLADYFFIELWLEGAARRGSKAPKKNIADRLRQYVSLWLSKPQAINQINQMNRIILRRDGRRARTPDRRSAAGQ